jgi:hypothetical protein
MELLLDYRIASHTPVAGYQLVPQRVLTSRSSWSQLESLSEGEFWENRRVYESHFDQVPRYLFDRRGFFACALMRSFVIARGEAGALDFLVPNDDAPGSAPLGRFRRFGRGKELPAGITIFNLSGEPLEIEGARVISWAVPPLVEGFRVEDLAWALMWHILDLAAERSLSPFAAYFHQDCLEAAALLRVSRTLNDGRPARIFIRDGVGGVRELKVVDRSDPEQIRRVLGIARSSER